MIVLIKKKKIIMGKKAVCMVYVYMYYQNLANIVIITLYRQNL